MKHQNGFAILSFSLLLPFFMTLFALGGYILLKTHEVEKSLHKCRKYTLEQQARFLKNFQQLLLLNPQARTLRLQNKQARWALRAALISGQPQVIIAAQRFLAFVQTQQSLLRTKQKLLLEQSQITALIFKNKYRVQLTKSLPFQNEVSTLGAWQLAVRATPLESESPSYIPRKDFVTRQKIGFRWKVKSPVSFNRSNPFVSLQCASTITHSGNNLWKVKLVF